MGMRGQEDTKEIGGFIYTNIPVEAINRSTTRRVPLNHRVVVACGRVFPNESQEEHSHSPGYAGSTTNAPTHLVHLLFTQTYPLRYGMTPIKS